MAANKNKWKPTKLFFRPFRCDEHYTLDDRGLFQDGTGSMPGVFQRDYSTYGIFVAFGDNAIANTAGTC